MGTADENPLYFAVTASDGYGIESQATQEFQADAQRNRNHYGAAKMLACDGKKVNLGETGKNLETRVVLVKTLQEVVAAQFYITDNQVNISRLKPGIYRLQSLDKRGIRHTLGTFVKKENKKS